MRRAAVVLAIALAAPASATAAFERRPYLQDARPDGAVLMWKTTGATAATVTITGAGGDRTIPVAAAAAPRVRITGLAPATRYRYRVVAGDDTATGELTTAPEPGAPVPVTFVVYGDTRSDAVAHYELVERVRAEVPDFILSTGDMVFDGGEERLWKQFFDIEGPLMADNVVYPALGNHDFENDGSEWIEKLFSPPEGRQQPGQYAFTYGPVRVIVLESNTPSFAMTDETAWLERQLQGYQQDPRLRHLFVIMHHPVYSISSHGGLPSLREKWAPLFERYGVTAVFSGHDHCYQRSEVGGVRYFVSGGGGAPLYGVGKRVSPIDAAQVTRFEKVNHYLRVHVIGDQVEVTAVRTDGTPIETLSFGGDGAGGKGPTAPASAAFAAGSPAAERAATPPAAARAPADADAVPAPTAAVSAPPVAAASAAPASSRLPPLAVLALGGLAALGALGLWRLTRPD